MTETCRQAELSNARKELDASRVKMDSIKTWGSKKRDAAEQVEFWGNKVAFLAKVRV